MYCIVQYLVYLNSIKRTGTLTCVTSCAAKTIRGADEFSRYMREMREIKFREILFKLVNTGRKHS
jgi:hypothetical protein